VVHMGLALLQKCLTRQRQMQSNLNGPLKPEIGAHSLNILN
jgi:hypothetical protein